MTVADLLKELEGVDPKTLVVLSRDEEGNGFKPLSDVEPYWFDTNEEEIMDDEEAGPMERAFGDHMGDVVRAMVLWP